MQIKTVEASSISEIYEILGDSNIVSIKETPYGFKASYEADEPEEISVEEYQDRYLDFIVYAHTERFGIMYVKDRNICFDPNTATRMSGAVAKAKAKAMTRNGNPNINWYARPV